MLHRIRTSRWKKADAVDITFTAGMNAIVGPNYVGKSSLLSAIFFALGGTSVVPGSMLETTTPGPGKFSVELWFLNYYIIRTKSKAELYENGKEEPIAVGTSVVNRRIGLILGMPVKRFMDLKFARQKKTEKILSMGGTELFNIIQDLTGINDVSKMIEKLSTRSKRTEGALEFVGFPEELTGPLEEKIKTLKSSLQEAENAAGKAEHAMGVAESETVRLRETLEKSTDAWGEHDKALKAYSDAFKAMEEAQARVTELKLDKVRILDGYPEESIHLMRRAVENDNALLNQFAARSAEHTTAVKELENAKNSVLAAQDKLDQATQQVSKYNDELGKTPRDSEARFTEVISSLATLSARVNELGRDIDEAEETLRSGVCPSCKRKYESETEEHRTLLQNNIASWRGEVTNAVEEKSKLQQEMEALNAVKDLCAKLTKAETAQDNWKQNLASCLAQEKKAEEAVESSRLALPMTSDEALEVEKKVVSRTKKLQEYDKQILRIDEAQRSLTRAEERVDQVSKPAEPVILKPAELRPQLTYAIQSEKEAKLVLSEAKQTLASTASLLANSEQEMVTLCQQVARKETLQRHTKAEQSLLKYLRTSRDRFTQDVWAQFLVRAGRFVRDCTAGRVTDLDRDEDGSFRYMEGGNWYTLAEASGCQLNLMGLAVQMALADVAPCPLNVLVADEPTDSMEDEHSLAAMVALASCGRQVICVTHKDLDRSLFDNVYEIERK